MYYLRLDEWFGSDCHWSESLGAEEGMTLVGNIAIAKHDYVFFWDRRTRKVWRAAITVGEVGVYVG